jgi:hypothetical protein
MGDAEERSPEKPIDARPHETYRWRELGIMFCGKGDCGESFGLGEACAFAPGDACTLVLGDVCGDRPSSARASATCR